MPRTNAEKLNHILNSSKYGQLSEAFVMHAVQAYADKVDKITEEQFGAGEFVAFEAWQGVAKEIKAELGSSDEQYDTDTEPSS